MYLYLIAIGWLYVVLLMALSERSAVAGAMTFVLYGALPLAVVLYIVGTPGRRRRAREREAAKRQSDAAATNAPQTLPQQHSSDR
jgi:membrane protein implicated in regulation of membrane protease activity